jgi:hypothetical protein
MKPILAILLAIILVSTTSFAYGPRGHGIVGAIADRRLANQPVISNRIKQILHDTTLEEAAQLPDRIKDWDKCKESEHPQIASVTSSKPINKELFDFHEANPCMGPSGHNYHRNFHFVDIPVVGNELYDDGSVGRSDTDIVHMLVFCERVLGNQEPEDNPFKITKAVAIILIAHYIGDLHQPLHVGAEYFDSQKSVFEPTSNNGWLDDRGGNNLTLFTFQHGKLIQAGNNFHSYWDGQTVDNAFGSMTNSNIANALASKEPQSWKLQGDPTTWPKQMANAIMPIAREAHSRLSFTDIIPSPHGHTVASGHANEKQTHGDYYAVWALNVAKNEIHKGGWQLAELLRQVLS